MTKEFENFDATMRELIKVPHSEIKEALDAEKSAKAAKKNTAKSSGKKRASKNSLAR